MFLTFWAFDVSFWIFYLKYWQGCCSSKFWLILEPDDVINLVLIHKKTTIKTKKNTKASHFNQTGIALHFSHPVSNLHAWQTYRGWRIISGVGKGWKGWNRGWVDVGAGITSPVRPDSTCSRGRSWAVWKRRPVIRGTAHNLNTTIRYSVSGKGFTSTCSRFYVEE